MIYTPIPDATVRLANLRSGQLDFIERFAPSDMEKIQAEKKLKTSAITEIGYQGITINVGKSDKAKAKPLGRDPRVREAFELSLDRAGLVQVVMDNEAIAGNQWVAPTNSWYAKNVPVPKRDIARAKQLLKEAGVPNPSFTLLTPTTSDAQRIALVVQAMAREAGFDVKIQAAEFATSLNMADKGDFEAYVLAWSGRPDPDGNLYILRRLQPAAQLRRLLRARGGRPDQAVARGAGPGAAQEGVRAGGGEGAEGPAHRLPVPPQVAVGLHAQAAGRARDPGRPAARERPEVRGALTADMGEFLVKRIARCCPRWCWCPC